MVQNHGSPRTHPRRHDEILRPRLPYRRLPSTARAGQPAVGIDPQHPESGSREPGRGAGAEFSRPDHRWRHHGRSQSTLRRRTPGVGSLLCKISADVARNAHQRNPRAGQGLQTAWTQAILTRLPWINPPWYIRIGDFNSNKAVCASARGWWHLRYAMGPERRRNPVQILECQGNLRPMLCSRDRLGLGHKRSVIPGGQRRMRWRYGCW